MNKSHEGVGDVSPKRQMAQGLFSNTCKAAFLEEGYLLSHATESHSPPSVPCSPSYYTPQRTTVSNIQSWMETLLDPGGCLFIQQIVIKNPPRGEHLLGAGVILMNKPDIFLMLQSLHSSKRGKCYTILETEISSMLGRVWN